MGLVGRLNSSDAAPNADEVINTKVPSLCAPDRPTKMSSMERYQEIDFEIVIVNKLISVVRWRRGRLLSHRK